MLAPHSPSPVPASPVPASPVPASPVPASLETYPVEPSSGPAPTFWSAILVVAGVVLFVDVELIAMAAAAVWATAGLLHLPLGVTAALAVAVGVPTLWACWAIARAAWRSEMGGEMGVPTRGETGGEMGGGAEAA